jgi:hypothetical protein
LEVTSEKARNRSRKRDKRPRSCGSLILLALLLLVLYNILLLPIPFRLPPQSPRALADIYDIEAALTSLLADADCTKLEELFDPDAVSAYMTKQRKLEHWPPVNAAEFAAATELYTRCMYAVLRSGRNAIGATDPVLTDLQYGAVLRDEVLGRILPEYLGIANDPWGNLYNIYPGPWNAKTPSGEAAPVPFRIYSKWEGDDTSADSRKKNRDGLEVQTKDEESGETIDAGFPAPTNEVAFIWSNGDNLLSSQLIYNANGYATGDRYDPAQGPEFAGGADDINSWDPGSSWGRFY